MPFREARARESVGKALAALASGTGETGIQSPEGRSGATLICSSAGTEGKALCTKEQTGPCHGNFALLCGYGLCGAVPAKLCHSVRLQPVASATPV